MSKGPRVRCGCCGLYGYRGGWGRIVGGAAGKYHAAECRLIACRLSVESGGINPGVVSMYSGRFNVSILAAQRALERALALQGGEQVLDRLRVLAGWLAPYQVPEQMRVPLILERLRLAAKAERYIDPAGSGRRKAS